jgi:hypothetical protein
MATRRYLYPSFMISYWPGLRGFGFDPVGTIPDVVNNSLLFCWDGVLDLIPALPEEWPKGSISGIKARGQIHVNQFEWDRPEGELNLELTSGVEQTLTLRLPDGSKITSMKILGGEASLTKIPGKSCCGQLILPAGETVRLALKFDD